jgi:hypothetical protein
MLEIVSFQNVYIQRYFNLILIDHICVFTELTVFETKHKIALILEISLAFEEYIF